MKEDDQVAPALPSRSKCKCCNEPLREIQIREMLGNPKYTEWARNGYCSLGCFERDGSPKKVTIEQQEAASENLPTGVPQAAGPCALCASRDNLHVCTVYLAKESYFREVRQDRGRQTTTHTTLLSNITPETFRLCLPCIIRRSKSVASRNRLTLALWGLAFLVSILLWFPVAATAPHSEPCWILAPLLISHLVTLGFFLGKWHTYRLAVTSGNPAIAAKEVCFTVCNRDYDILQKGPGPQTKNLIGFSMNPISSRVICLTPAEMEERRKEAGTLT